MSLARAPLLTAVPRLVRWLLGSAFIAFGVLQISGAFGDPLVWAYVAACSAVLLIGTVVVPEATAPARWTSGRTDQDPLSPYVFRALFLGHVVVGALDAGRLHWSDSVPVAARIVGLAGFTLAFALTFWAAGVNRFFKPSLQIQGERGHHLVTAGPYAFVRHPGYAGMFWGVPLSALALGSWIAVGLAAVMAAFVARRVLLEDRFVMAALPGYADYAARVPYRLLPGVW